MDRFLLALRFLTILPVGAAPSGPPSKEALSSTLAFFPLVGAFQGLILVIVLGFLGGALPWGVVSALLIAVLTLTNGGFHLDGFADTVDGLAGGSTPGRRLEIMRDHTTGAIGVVFLIIILLVKFVSLDAVPASLKGGAVFAFPVIGRWAMVVLSCNSTYARKTGGLGEAFASATPSTLFWATIVTAVLSLVALGAASLLVLAGVAIAAYLSSRFFARKLGGVTGDVFGFQSEISEVLALLGILLLC